MRFLPIENIILKTSLKTSEVEKRISGLISGFTKKYEGEIFNLTFDIKRIIEYRNSFLPRIKGVIKKEFDGTTIEVKMRLNVFVSVFICIWLAGVGLGCLAVLNTMNNKEFQPTTLIPFAMLLFGYLMTLGGFKYESSKAKKELQVLLEAELSIS